MKAVVQRVTKASVMADNKIEEIKNGFVVFLAIHKDDTIKNIEHIVKKIINLRIFEDENGKMARSIVETGGECLIIPQFTLYGSIKDGNRPDFTEAMKKNDAFKIFERVYEELKKHIPVKKGFFGEYMKVDVENDGPVTIIIDA